MSKTQIVYVTVPVGLPVNLSLWAEPLEKHINGATPRIATVYVDAGDVSQDVATALAHSTPVTELQGAALASFSDGSWQKSPDSLPESFWKDITDVQAITERAIYLISRSSIVVVDADSPSFGETAVSAMLGRMLGKKIVAVTSKTFAPVWLRRVADMVVTPETVVQTVHMLTVMQHFEAASQPVASKKTKKALANIK